MERIFVCADIIPGPPVEAAFAHARDVIRWKIVSQTVTFVGRAPEIAGRGIYRHADAIANAARVNAPALTFRIEHEDIGALEFIVATNQPLLDVAIKQRFLD